MTHRRPSLGSTVMRSVKRAVRTLWENIALIGALLLLVRLPYDLVGNKHVSMPWHDLMLAVAYGFVWVSWRTYRKENDELARVRAYVEHLELQHGVDQDLLDYYRRLDNKRRTVA